MNGDDHAAPAARRPVEPHHSWFAASDLGSNVLQRTKALKKEPFYQRMHAKHYALMEPQGHRTGGCWNFDTENRKR